MPDAHKVTVIITVTHIHICRMSNIGLVHAHRIYADDLRLLDVKIYDDKSCSRTSVVFRLSSVASED